MSSQKNGHHNPCNGHPQLMDILDSPVGGHYNAHAFCHLKKML